MSVIKADAAVPSAREVSTRLRASANALSRSGMKAPSPVLTSKTTAAAPVASFLERMLPVIRGRESTVAVTSRMA
jgi:hypothetical protein